MVKWGQSLNDHMSFRDCPHLTIGGTNGCYKDNWNCFSCFNYYYFTKTVQARIYNLYKLIINCKTNKIKYKIITI